jgi:hypothetical protein
VGSTVDTERGIIQPIQMPDNFSMKHLRCAGVSWVAGNLCS